jgi:hypothetical protein
MSFYTVQLRMDPVGTVDGRLILSLIHLLRSARDQVHSGTLTLGDVLRADAPIIDATLRHYGLASRDTYMLYDMAGFVLGTIAQQTVPGFAPDGDPDQIDVLQLTTLPASTALRLLATACGQVNATLAQF